MKNDNVFRKCFVLILLFANGLAPVFGQQESIILNVEEPENASIYTGVSNIRGYALARAGVARVELYINGRFVANIPFGGRRPDVGSAFPDYPNASESGFSMAYNYSNLESGQNTMTLKAIDNNNAELEKSTTYSVTRFEFGNAGNFLGDPSLVNLGGATVDFGGNELFVKKLLADGKIYDVQLQWRAPSQDFDITKITLIDGSPTMPDVAGTWTANTSLAAQNCFSDASALPQNLVYIFVLNQENSVLRGVLNSKDANLAGLGVYGGVLAGDNFVLDSRALIVDSSANGPGCYAAQVIRVSGDFSSGAVQVLTGYAFGQTCPANLLSACQIAYRGTAAKN